LLRDVGNKQNRRGGEKKGSPLFAVVSFYAIIRIHIFTDGREIEIFSVDDDSDDRDEFKHAGRRSSSRHQAPRAPLTTSTEKQTTNQPNTRATRRWRKKQLERKNIWQDETRREREKIWKKRNAARELK